MNDVLEISKIIETRTATPAVAAKGTCAGDRKRLLGMRDAMEVLSGKWKLQIIGTLLFEGKMRFMDLRREVDGIAAKMLSKELQDLESHNLVKRTVMGTKPITVEYEITPHGRSVEKVVVEIVNWGQLHRERIMKVS
jgi:DNA-binding HxlR family transcriptional regulator